MLFPCLRSGSIKDCTSLYRDERQRNPPTRGRGCAPGLSPGPSPPGPSSSLSTTSSLLRSICDITPHVHVRSTIKRNLTSTPRQTNSRFLFPISDKVSYVTRQSNRCLCEYAEFDVLVFGSDGKTAFDYLTA